MVGSCYPRQSLHTAMAALVWQILLHSFASDYMPAETLSFLGSIILRWEEGGWQKPPHPDASLQPVTNWSLLVFRWKWCVVIIYLHGNKASLMEAPTVRYWVFLTRLTTTDVVFTWTGRVGGGIEQRSNPSSHKNANVLSKSCFDVALITHVGEQWWITIK